MKRLNGLDSVLLYGEAPNLHMHTLKVLVLQPEKGQAPPTIDSVRRSLEERIHLLDPLRWRLLETPWRLHHPCWVEDPQLDLRYHLRRVAVPSPAGRRELNKVIGEVASTPLARNRPLWELYFAEGLSGNRYALIGKVHHSLADGVASANLMARLMGLEQQAADNSSPAAGPLPRREALMIAMRDHVAQATALPKLVRDTATGLSELRRRARDRGEQRDTAKMFSPPTSFLNHVVSPLRTFANATLPLADARDTAKALGVTFNDLVLATVTGALRDLLLRYDGRADRPLLSNVPISTDRSAERISGNALSGLPVSLPVHIDDPLERMRLVAFSTQIAKEDHHAVGPDVYSRLMGYIPTALAPAAFRRQAARARSNSVMNIPVSNVPGPRQRGEIGGAPVYEFYSTGVLSAGAAVNITVWSYVDQLNVAVLSDDRTFTDVHEATDAIIHAFSEIRAAAGFEEAIKPVLTAMASASASEASRENPHD